MFVQPGEEEKTGGSGCSFHCVLGGATLQSKV